MSEEKKTRVRRSADQRKAAIDEKIKYHYNCIKTLEAKKAEIDKAETARKTSKRQKGIKRIISENKFSDTELADALGIPLDKLRAKLAKAADAKAASDAQADSNEAD